MVTVQPLVSEFTLIGKLEDLLLNSKGRVKCLYLSTSDREYVIKVAKEQKNILSRYLKPGCKLKVSGMRKCKPHKLGTEYKAYVIELLAAPIQPNVNSSAAKSKSLVLICQSSSCCKQGGKAVYKKLRAELYSQGIAEQVEIKTTGCLKQCKQGPNLVMPGKHRYSNVKPQQVSALVKQHLI